jgi:hypothetical protein
MNITKKSMCIIIEVLLMLSIMFGVLCIFFQKVILNENTYTKILEKSNAYEQIKESIYSKIDAALSAKNINYDIKKSIITEDDIKKEADNEIPGVIDYLKTGKNNIKPVDTEIYKKRAADLIHSTMSSIINPNGDLSYNDKLINAQNTSIVVNKYKVNDMMTFKAKGQDGQADLKVERLMSRDEAEARVKALLKQKGLTVDQAIKKAQEKGITEEQALKILAGYGITIDGEPAQGDTNTNINTNTNTNTNKESSGKNSSAANKDNTSSDANGSLAAGNSSKSAQSTDQKGTTNTSENPLDIIENKLIDEADNDIEKEVEKVDFNKILDNSKYKRIAQITSIVYKMFWLFMILPVIFMAILVKMNKEKILYPVKQIGRTFLTSGLILSAIFTGAYAFKVYEKINIGPIYFKEITSYGIKYLLELLLMYGVITFMIGLLIFIFVTIKIKKQSLNY